MKNKKVRLDWRSKFDKGSTTIGIRFESDNLKEEHVVQDLKKFLIAKGYRCDFQIDFHNTIRIA